MEKPKNGRRTADSVSMPAQKATYPAFTDMAGWLQISGDRRSTAYEKMADGRLRGVKQGKSLRIDVQHGLAAMHALPPVQVRRAEKKKSTTNT